LRFKTKYPHTFYDRLEDEINVAFSNPELPDAVLMLSRKLIENLVYNLLEYKFKEPGIDLYYNTAERRAHDFGVLLKNLKTRKPEFALNQQEHIDKFLQLVPKFRREANSKAHMVIEYLDSMREIKELKIPEMAQHLLELITLVK
jgi:hypothetical protein